MEQIPYNLTQPSWILILLLFCAILIVLAKLYDAKKFVVFAFLPFNNTNKEYEEGFNPHGVKDVFDIFLTINAYVVYSLSIFLVSKGLNGGFNFFIRILFVLLIFLLFKALIQLSIGWLFSKNEDIAKMQSISMAYRSWAALWIFSILPIVIYTPLVFNVGSKVLLVSIVMAYVVGLLFGLIRFWKVGCGKYYKILYICALEIVPFFFLISWFKDS